MSLGWNVFVTLTRMEAKDGNDVKYDPNNLPQDIVDELNDQDHYSLNSLRKQLGIT